jgi:hypothetical protein
MLLVETGDDATAARHGAGAIFVIVRLAGAALISGLCNSMSRRSDGEDKKSEAQFRHEISSW